MAKLPQIKKILREDLKDAPPWVNALIDPLNQFMETTYQALNRNLSLQDNLASFIKELSYSTPSTYPTGVQTVSFQNQLKSKPIGVQLLQVYDKATYTPAPGPVYIPWIIDNSGNIQISAITGLEPSKNYLVRLVIY